MAGEVVRYSDQFLGTQLRTTELYPYTDTWLGEPDRTWEEVDAVLESRLQSLQTNFTASADGEVPYLLRAYGLEKPASERTARFLSYVELADEYRQLTTDYGDYATLQDTAYEAEKLQEKAKGKKGYYARIQKLQKKYNLEIVGADAQKNEADKVHELILRKAALEFLSAAEADEDHSLIHDFPKLLHETRERFWDNPNPPDEFRNPRSPIEQFVTDLGDYLAATDQRDLQDRELMARYEYRQTPELISTGKDCEVLDTMLQCQLDPEGLTDDEGEQELLQHLGEGYFPFLARRAAYRTNQSYRDEYPYLSLVYDLYTAAVFRGKKGVLENLSSLVDSQLLDALQTGMAEQELNRYFARELSQYSIMISDFERRILVEMDRDMQNPDNLVYRDSMIKDLHKRFYSAMPTDAVNAHTSIEYRIMDGIHGLKAAIKRSAESFLVLPSKSMDMINDRFSKSNRTEGFQLLIQMGITEKQLNLFHQLMSGIRSQDYVDMTGISVDLRAMISHPPKYLEDSMGNNTLVGDQDLLNKLQIIFNQLSVRSNTSTVNLEIVKQYLENRFRESPEVVERMERENDYLWREILDNPLWFVSPRGDRYSAERGKKNNDPQSGNDPQLKEYMIDSVTFNIDKTHPREHQVKVLLKGFDHPLVFLLDTDNNLLGPQRQILPIEPSHRQAFTNLLLKRLYVITSASLSTMTEEGEEGEGTRNFEYRRAHYRILPSTTDRPITMESDNAKTHAKEIKEAYGIDIYEEIGRRRKIGTLEPHEYLTFVRESEPQVTSEQAKMPNELRFDPTLLILPI